MEFGFSFQSIMIRPVCGVVLFVVLLIAVLDHAQGCGRKKQTEDCNPTLWDATRRTCHDELFVKRDVANIAEEGEVVFFISLQLATHYVFYLMVAQKKNIK